MTINTLNSIPALAADYIEEHGWTAGAMQNEDGAVCLHGAIQACTPQKGDAEIVRAVARAKGYTEEWNDTAATKPKVLDALRGLTVTDADLAEVFGPQWREIVALVRRAAVLTEDEAATLAAAWPVARNDAGKATWAAREAARVAGGATGEAAREAAGGAIWVARDAIWVAGATRDATRASSWPATWATTRVAAGALSARHLIGQHGFTQEHYDTLTAPWRSVIGPRAVRVVREVDIDGEPVES